MRNTLKDYIVDYRNGDINAINDLIYIKKVREQNSYGGEDLIDRIAYRDKKLQQLFNEICFEQKDIDNKDIENIFLNIVYDVVFPKADIERSSQEIISWIYKVIPKRVIDKINEWKLDGKFTEPEEYTNNNESNEDDEYLGRNLSNYDLASFLEFSKVESSPGYNEFLDFIGGIDKILTKSQYKLFELIQDQSKKQEEIAQEYGSSQENISKMITTIHKKIKEEWIYYKSIKAVGEVMRGGLYGKIKRFMESFDDIITFDIQCSFDYFGYVIKFLKDNYKLGEHELNISKYDDQLKINKRILHMTVFDLLTDEVTKKTYINLLDILENRVDIDIDFNAYSYGQREQRTIVNQVIKVFRCYIDECEKEIKKASGYIARQNNIRTNNLLKVS